MAASFIDAMTKAAKRVMRRVLPVLLLLAWALPVHAQQLNPGGAPPAGIFTSPINITGTATNGSDQINSVNINGILNPMTYGAKCDGVTDDSAALQTWLTACQGHSCRWPDNKTCVHSAPLVYNVGSFGQFAGNTDIMGGTNSVEQYTGTGAALTFLGTYGVTQLDGHISGWTIRGPSLGTATDLLVLNGVAGYSITDMHLWGNDKTNNCLHLIGAQQGRIEGGSIQACKFYNEIIESSTPGVGGAGSNGVYEAGVQIGGLGNGPLTCNVIVSQQGSDDMTFIGNHFVAGTTGANFDGSCGGGRCNVISNHFETANAGQVDVILRAGWWLFSGNSVYPTNGGPTATSILTGAGSQPIIEGNLITGKINIQAGTNFTIFKHNSVASGTITDNGNQSTFEDNEYIDIGPVWAGDLAANHWAGSFNILPPANGNATLRVNSAAMGAGQTRLQLIAGTGSTNRATRVDFFNNVASTTTARWSIANDWLQTGINDLAMVNPAAITVFDLFPDGGLTLGNPAGSSKGMGTLNVAGGIYQNGGLYTYPDYVFDSYYGQFMKAKKPDPTYHGLLSLPELEAFIKKNHELPRINESKDSGEMFHRTDRLLEKVEELTLYVIDLQKQIDALKHQREVASTGRGTN